MPMSKWSLDGTFLIEMESANKNEPTATTKMKNKHCKLWVLDEDCNISLMPAVLQAERAL